ncbi:helix-turn-helix domain-containing protein [Burkholderia sp. AU30280]|uniref:HNH endonuclease n=1 Tax=Burkholderia sp. AU30280 TaxID=2879628 RepID=UPI001CF4133A|nr:helix-turn-helix domain-containing protein [Burkholderia sp. AU30280]MCA8276376.1 helix-turn-helix domain-containing protein [Burkholderia sp. AU30280]
MKDDVVITAEHVRAARSLLHWSQQDLALKANVGVSTVADFERGQRMPVANNVLAIRRALELAGVTFTTGGVDYGFQWTFITEAGISSMHMGFGPESAATLREFMAIFGSGEAAATNAVKLNMVQCATSELKSKLSSYVDSFGKSAPHLYRLQKLVNGLRDAEFFLVVPVPLASTSEQHQLEQLVYQLNHPDERSFAAEHKRLFGDLLAAYDMVAPRTDKRVDIGNARKSDRTCRFCGRTKATGATFSDEAHAIPAALGNQFLKLSDECDTCNHFFGEKIEPTLIELLNVQRVFLGTESRGSKPTIKFANGQILNDGKQMIVISEKISEEASGVLTAQLGEGKRIVPVNFYKALCKIALSVIPEAELPALEKTARWLRFGEPGGVRLPKVAAAIVPLPPEPSAQIVLYVRREDTSKLPHVVCEFRLGCYIYVYALPFSTRDAWDLIDFFEDDTFKETFRHYASVPSWVHQDYSNDKEITVVQNIKMVPRTRD